MFSIIYYFILRVSLKLFKKLMLLWNKNYNASFALFNHLYFANIFYDLYIFYFKYLQSVILFASSKKLSFENFSWYRGRNENIGNFFENIDKFFENIDKISLKYNLAYWFYICDLALKLVFWFKWLTHTPLFIRWLSK